MPRCVISPHYPRMWFEEVSPSYNETSSMLRLFLFFAFVLLPFSASAALIPNAGAALDVSVRPEYPRPNDVVTVRISDPGNESSTGYVWSVDGKMVEQGIGTTAITVTTGDVGEVKVVEVIATQNGAIRASGTAFVRPGSIDIVWEGNTVTPPFYDARPLPNGGGTLTVLAVPHLSVGGSEVDPSILSYSWKIDGIPVTKQSGYGKSSAVLTPPRFGSAFTISVTATNQDGTAQAQSSVVIRPQTPKIIIYENAPLLGVRFNRIVSGLFAFKGDEVSFNAYPLFASSVHALTYEWSIDGKPFTVDELKPLDVKFRKVGEGVGSHLVTIMFSNPHNFIENGKGTFGLQF